MTGELASTRGEISESGDRVCEVLRMQIKHWICSRTSWGHTLLSELEQSLRRINKPQHSAMYTRSLSAATSFQVLRF